MSITKRAMTMALSAFAMGSAASTLPTGDANAQATGGCTGTNGQQVICPQPPGRPTSPGTPGQPGTPGTPAQDQRQNQDQEQAQAQSQTARSDVEIGDSLGIALSMPGAATVQSVKDCYMPNRQQNVIVGPFDFSRSTSQVETNVNRLAICDRVTGEARAYVSDEAKKARNHVTMDAIRQENATCGNQNYGSVATWQAQQAGYNGPALVAQPCEVAPVNQGTLGENVSTSQNYRLAASAPAPAAPAPAPAPAPMATTSATFDEVSGARLVKGVWVCPNNRPAKMEDVRVLNAQTNQFVVLSRPTCF